MWPALQMLRLKLSDYLADHHSWISLLSCPGHHSFTRTQRLSVNLLLLLGYACVNAAIVSQMDDQVGLWNLLRIRAAPKHVCHHYYYVVVPYLLLAVAIWVGLYWCVSCFRDSRSIKCVGSVACSRNYILPLSTAWCRVDAVRSPTSDGQEDWKGLTQRWSCTLAVFFLFFFTFSIGFQCNQQLLNNCTTKQGL